MMIFLSKLFKDGLYSNSIYLIFSSIINSLIGLLFWITAAKQYSSAEIGIATAIISSISFIVLISRIGLDNSLVRFFPKGNKNDILSTTIVVTTTLALTLGISFILTIDIFSPSLQVLKSNAILFLFFLMVSSTHVMIDMSIITLRLGKYKILLGLITGVKILLLVPLVFLGSIGIFISAETAIALALIISLFILYKHKIRTGKINIKYLRSSLQFSCLSYFSTLFIATPALLLPIIILNNVGDSSAAHFYMAFSYASIIFIIPSSASTSLFVEGSHGEDLDIIMKKCLKFSISLLLPLIAGTFLFGSFFLSIIGKEYELQGLGLLQMFAISSIFVTIFQTQYSIHLVKKDLGFLTFCCMILCTLIISLSVFFMNIVGIVGVGYAWIISYATICLIIYLYSYSNKNNTHNISFSAENIIKEGVSKSK